MNNIQKISLAYLLAILLVFWGYRIGKHEAFPYSIIQDISAFVAGHPLEADTTAMEKLANDAGLVPTRFLWDYPAGATQNGVPIEIVGTRSRREAPVVFVAPDARSGYRAVFGALDFEEALWGGVLLSPDGHVLHTWKLSTNHLPGNLLKRDALKNMYGVHLFPDGSVIFSQQEHSGGIVRTGACGDIVWNLEGEFHHTVSPTDDGTFWTYQGLQEVYDHVLVEASVATGEIVRTIDMAEVRRKNELLHIFNLQSNQTVTDISHGNDIDPLPDSLADAFAMFSPGDLLISHRTHNLVFVLDPGSLEIKWWRIGPWDRQHDPDWEADGEIVVFSNNEITDREFSDIVAIDPVSFAHRLVVDGSGLGFSSGINGDHERTPYGTRMVTSSTQGWAFEVDDSGEVVFSFVNVYEAGKGKALHLSEAIRLEETYFDTEFWKECDDHQE